MLAAPGQTENSDSSGLWEISPGECYLDGLISPPHKSIEDMHGFEVPLVAFWNQIDLGVDTRYRGDAKFGVYNFKIGGGELIKAYTVDINLNRDNPELSEKERHKNFIYSCEDSGSCTATLATVKGAITEQIARDHETEVEDIVYEEDSRVNFLGVFVKGMDPLGMGTSSTKGRIHLHTEVCGAYKIILAEAHTVK